MLNWHAHCHCLLFPCAWKQTHFCPEWLFSCHTNHSSRLFSSFVCLINILILCLIHHFELKQLINDWLFPTIFNFFYFPHPICRFQFFLDKVLPQYRDSVMSHTLIYIPSYFDYVRLRNYMKKEEIKFASTCEYSSKSEVSRARHFFQKGERQFLLFTERFHFYKRSVLFNDPSGSTTCAGLCLWFKGGICLFTQQLKRANQLVNLL